jgi:hypothetical protein
MTEVIDRVQGHPVGGMKDDSVPSWLSEPEARSSQRRLGPIHVFVAILLGSNVVLLMANVSHVSGWRAGGAIAIAWVEIGLGVACLARPIRSVAGLTAATSLLGLGLWLSINKVPLVAHSVIWVGVGLATAAFVSSLVLLVNPTLAANWTSSTLVLTSVVPVGVVIVTTAALLVAPKPSVAHAPTVPQSFASASAALAQKTTVQVPGENSKQFQEVLAGNTSEQTELKPFVPLNPTDQAVLTGQLSQALQAAEKFPTVATAKAAGMILAGGMAPGVGAHYQEIGASDLTSLDGTFNPSEPASWIYASTANNAPVVGVMYESLTAQPPAGFIGPNDHWHRHSNVCVQFTGGKIAVPFAADQSVTPQECSDVHGVFMKKTVWMVHAWVVPGWESPQGVFSHDNLHVYCPGNTDLVDAIGFCTRQQ